MVRTPIQLDFSEVLFSLTEDLWDRGSIESIKWEDLGSITKISDNDKYYDFEKELVDIVRDCPGDIAKLKFLGDYGILRWEYRKDKGWVNQNHIPVMVFYIMTYNGGSFSGGNLIPNPGNIRRIHNIGCQVIPNYELRFGVFMPGSAEREERSVALNYRQRFEYFRDKMMGMPVGDDIMEDFTIYLVKSSEARNLYLDLKSLEEQKIPYEG